MTTIVNESNGTSSNKGWNIGLWAAQIALTGLFGMGVYMHLFLSPAEMVEMGALWAESAPIWLIRFIGFAELAGIIGLILPAATRIKPELTVLAAKGLLAIQVLAILFHIVRGEFAVLPFNLIFAALAVLVIWGRTKKSPLSPRA
jgi:hypothetical protein